MARSWKVVRTGLDIAVNSRLDFLRGKRIGLISHPAAVLPDLTSALDALLAAGVRLTALFAMEHGFAGASVDGSAVENARDGRTGLPVFSLYGATEEPTAEMLAGVDVLVYDVQDVGARFYTFISTLYRVLRAARRHGKAVVVLDRPNPINGVAIEGPLLEPGFESFVGIAPIPIRHGMTVGELARYFNAPNPPGPSFDKLRTGSSLGGKGGEGGWGDERGFGADLTVIPMEGWRREMWFNETGLPWVPTSPAMPHLSTATVYPGTCLVEGTNLSEGRGTALPFEVIGAPWLDGYALAQALNRLVLPGVRFRPTEFIPTASKHIGQLCCGVQLHVTERAAFRPIVTGLHVIAACREQAPDRFTFLSSSWEGRQPHFDLLTGGPAIRAGLVAGVPVEELTTGWAAIAAEFERERRPYLLYK